jgi:hypothetical protein
MKKVLFICLVLFIVGCKCVQSRCRGVVKEIEYRVYQQNGAFEHPPKVYTFVTYEDNTKYVYEYKKELQVGGKDCECTEWN